MKTSSKIVKSVHVLELEIQKQLVAFVLKHVIVGLIRKGKLPRFSKLCKFIKKMSVQVGWAVVMLPVCQMVDNKELSVPVGFALLILTRRINELSMKLVTPNATRIMTTICLRRLASPCLVIRHRG